MMPRFLNTITFGNFLTMLAGVGVLVGGLIQYKTDIEVLKIEMRAVQATVSRIELRLSPTNHAETTP